MSANISTNLGNISVLVDGVVANNSNGTRHVEFVVGNETVVEFDFNFSSWSLKVRLFPFATDANPHCVLIAKRSNGTNLLASCTLRTMSASFSKIGDFVVIRPRTTILSFGTCRSGKKSPALSLSNSRSKRST